jgi:hypothetical protein
MNSASIDRMGSVATAGESDKESTDDSDKDSNDDDTTGDIVDDDDTNDSTANKDEKWVQIYIIFVPQLQLLLHNKLSLSNIISATETQWSGNMLTHQVMHFWIKRRDKLVHDYSFVGYILSPNPTIMASRIVNKSQMHNKAAERLITKLILDQSVVGNERRIARANLIDTFLTNYGDFINKRNSFALDHI